MEKLEAENGKKSREEYTEDGTVDLKGNPVLRSNTGRWRATSFIVGICQHCLIVSFDSPYDKL